MWVFISLSSSMSLSYSTPFPVLSFILPLLSCLSSSTLIASSTECHPLQQMLLLLTSQSTWCYSPVGSRTPKWQRDLRYAKGSIQKWDSENRKFRGGPCFGLSGILAIGQCCTYGLMVLPVPLHSNKAETQGRCIISSLGGKNFWSEHAIGLPVIEEVRFSDTGSPF